MSVIFLWFINFVSLYRILVCGNKLGMKKSKWTAEQIELLLCKAANGNVRIQAFKDVAEKLGRRPNSVRNYYYKYHAKDKAEIVPFGAGESRKLLREIVLGTSRGESVRSICLRMARSRCLDNGKRNVDGATLHSGMLRLQNKYRTVLSKNPEQIDKIVGELSEQGYIVKSPVKEVVKRSVREVGKVLSDDVSSTARIIQMPEMKNNKVLTDADINNLFMGLVRLVKQNSSDEIEKLKAEIERLKNKEKTSYNLK